MKDSMLLNAASPSEVRERPSLRLEIDPVIARAEALVVTVDKELPGHPGIARVARCVAQVARDAKDVSRHLKRPIGFHRLPASFLVLSLLLLAGWVYWQFIHVSQLTIAVPAQDAVQLKSAVTGRIRFMPRVTVGSRESIGLLERKEVDLAFIQGGIEFPDDFPHVELGQSEVVLLFLRSRLTNPAEMRKVLTSEIGQGSHSMAQLFTRAWGIADKVQYVHDWRVLTSDPAYKISADIDGVFVVKDPMSENLDGIAARIASAGLRLVSPDIGALSLRMPFLHEHEMRAGFLDPNAHLPSDSVKTYAAVTYLVGRAGLTSHQLASAEQLVHPSRGFPTEVAPTLNTASEMAQGVEAVLGIVVYIGLAFLALLGLDLMAYRRRFHELNTLVSLISMHQSSKDVIMGTVQQKAHHVAYLTVCSDLLGLIAVITGYYTQENSSLLYNRLSDIIHERCSGLKINIQLKILHALIDLPGLHSNSTSDARPDSQSVDERDSLPPSKVSNVASESYAGKIG